MRQRMSKHKLQSTNGRSASKIRPALVDKSKNSSLLLSWLSPVINFLFSFKIETENSNRNDVFFFFLHGTKRKLKSGVCVWELEYNMQISYLVTVPRHVILNKSSTQLDQLLLLSRYISTICSPFFLNTQQAK